MSWLSGTTWVLVTLVAGLVSVGPGIAGYTTWIITGIILVGLALVAWWSRPARRATRTELREARRRRDSDSTA